MTSESAPSSRIDALELAQALIRCPSVTPADAGALDVLESALKRLGFVCHRLPFEEDGTPRVDNLYARLGTRGPNFCFAGHTDVVPVGDEASWTVDPFGAEVINNTLYGRGATDMKTAIACFVSAVSEVVGADNSSLPGSISLLITGDEEGPAVNGTVKVLDWLKANGETLDHCLVGEPTNPMKLGEMVKVGRRGSINGVLRVLGAQGHVAYPHLAENPIPRMLAMLRSITDHELDQGTEHFQPSNLEVTSVDVGNAATNVIPAEVTARFNIRFNNLHTGASLEKWLRSAFDAVGGAYEFDCRTSGEAFLTEPGPFTSLLSGAIEDTLGASPELSTSGGTSDARFIKNACPVAEFGLVGQTMHKVDELCRLDDLQALQKIYTTILTRYFTADFQEQVRKT